MSLNVPTPREEEGAYNNFSKENIYKIGKIVTATIGILLAGYGTKKAIIQIENEDAIIGKGNLHVIDGEIKGVFDVKNPPKKMLLTYLKSYIYSTYYYSNFYEIYRGYVDRGNIEQGDSNPVYALELKIAQSKTLDTIYEEYCKTTESISDEQWTEMSRHERRILCSVIVKLHWDEDSIDVEEVIKESPSYKERKGNYSQSSERFAPK